MSVILNNDEYFKEILINYNAGLYCACLKFEEFLKKKRTNKEIQQFIEELKLESEEGLKEIDKKPKTSVLK